MSVKFISVALAGCYGKEQCFCRTQTITVGNKESSVIGKSISAGGRIRWNTLAKTSWDKVWRVFCLEGFCFFSKQLHLEMWLQETVHHHLDRNHKTFAARKPSANIPADKLLLLKTQQLHVVTCQTHLSFRICAVFALHLTNTSEFYHLVSQHLSIWPTKANKCLGSWIMAGCLWPVKLDTCSFVNDLATLRWLWDRLRSRSVWEAARICALMRNLFFFQVM